MIVAGEASADLHGAHVVAEINRRFPEITVFGAGGAAMRETVFEELVPAESMSLAGLTEVLMGLPRMFKIMGQLVTAARERRPLVAVLLDLPDFNLRLAKRLKKLGIPVVYYISPQLWAWRRGRVEQVRRYIDKMLVILPFEKPFYEEHSVDVEFVGHPLVEELEDAPNQREARTKLGLPADGPPVVAVLPGSRLKEVSRNLPTMLEGLGLVAERVPGLKVLIPVASTVPIDMIHDIVDDSNLEVEVVDGHAVDVVRASDAALVCSGTSTLQTALLARPMVVVYRVSWLTYAILKRLVRVAHIALVNLIAGRRLVPELIQDAFTPTRIQQELLPLLEDQTLRSDLAQAFTNLRDGLGTGSVSSRVADALDEYLNPEEQDRG